MSEFTAYGMGTSTWAVEYTPPLSAGAKGVFSHKLEYGPSNLSAFMTWREMMM
jgi:hypothetical protein